MPFRLDGKTHGWGIMIFVKEDIPCKFLSVENQAMQGWSVEVSLIWKRKCLALISMGDFSMKANDNVVSDFIDITFAKKPQSFQQFCVIETSLSDLHRMTVFAMKTAFDKL